MLTRQRDCEIQDIDPEELKKARDRMTGSVKMDQLTPEARENMLRMAEEGVRDKHCSRARLPLKMVLSAENKIIHQAEYVPRGVTDDGLVHVRKKIDIPAGVSQLKIQTFEKSIKGLKNPREKILVVELKPGLIYYIDFDQQSAEFYLRGQ